MRNNHDGLYLYLSSFETASSRYVLGTNSLFRSRRGTTKTVIPNLGGFSQNPSESGTKIRVLCEKRAYPSSLMVKTSENPPFCPWISPILNGSTWVWLNPPFSTQKLRHLGCPCWHSLISRREKSWISCWI